MKHLMNDLKGWFDKGTRDEYVGNFGWKQFAFDITTILIEMIWMVVSAVMHVVLLVIYVPLKFVVLLIEFIHDLELHQKSFFWRKRAWFKTELIQVKERKY